MIRVVFMGTPEFAVPVLQGFIDDPDINVVMVVTQPDKPVGREGVVTPPPVKILAQSARITIVQPDDINGDDVVEMVSGVEPDFIVVVAYGQILGRKILKLAKREILNVHASLLPKYRGASPIQASILNGDEKTGVSIMGVRRKMDAGPVYLQEEVCIGAKNLIELSSELTNVGTDAIIRVIKNFDSFKSVEQGEDASYCSKVAREDGEIFFEDMSAVEIMRRYRAFYGWPGVFTFLQGKRIVLVELEASDIVCSDEAGDVCEADNGVYIMTKDGSIELKRVKSEGKKEMSGAEFMRGWKSRAM